MRRLTTALALAAALGGLALPAAADHPAEIDPRSLVTRPAPPDLAGLLDAGNAPLVCHLAHSAVRDRQDSGLALTLDDALSEAVDGTRTLIAVDGATPCMSTSPAPATTQRAAPVAERDADALTPADVMLMVAALALASLSILVVRG